MNSSSEDRNPIELLAEEFLARHRRGERPTPTEYAERHPEHAAAIREAFPALLMMEQLKPVPGDLTGSLQFGAGPDDDPGIPPVIGEYRILRQIGRGGMGVVYEAVQESLGRHVALKVLPPTALGQSFLERFRREARAAARLHHTNIVPVFGTGEWHAEGVGPPVPYFAMQFIPGQGLDQVLDDVRRLRGAAGADFVPAESVARSLCSGEFAPARTGSDPDDRETPPAAAPTDLGSASELTDQSSGNPYYRSVARIGLQVAEALAYAHRMGVLHRDIKPSNLLLDPQGTAWVADFGLAKAEDNDDLTHTGDVVGTVRFMAPERFDGHSLPQSDVYSLGLTLYEMVALRPAFEERVREKLIKKVLQEPVPPLRQHDPAVPRDLETIIGKCVAKDPAERYASAQELAEDLRRYLADRPIRARRHTAAEKFWRWCRRNPAVAGLLGLALLLVVTVAVVSSAAAIQLREKNGQVTQALADAEKAERERREQLVEAYLEKARANRHSRRQGQRFETLDAIRKAAELARELHLPTEKFDAMRNEAIVALTLPDLRQAKSWDFFPLSFDALHQSYLRVEQGGRVSVRTVADDRERYGWTAFDPPTELSGCLSPDGQYVWVYAYWQDRRLKVWRLTGPEPAAVLAPLANVTAADFSRDSREVAVAGADGSLSRYDLATGNVVRTVKLPGVAQTLAYDPTADGRLAAGCGNTVFLLNRKTGEVTGKGWKHPAGVRALAWHPQGDLLAAADDDGKIYLWNPESAQQVSVLEGNKGGVWSINFNRRGDVLVSSDGEAMLRFWHPRMGKQLFATQGNQKAPGFDADDRHIAAHVAGPSGQWKNGLWEVASPKEYRTLVHDPVPGRPPQQWGASLHPNGRWLAVAMSDGPRIWDLDSGRQLAWLPIGRTYCVWFEPSGALLTSNPGGLWRWPVAVTMSDDVPRIGPPRRLPIPNIGEHVSTSRDGRVLAVPLGGGAAIIHADRPYQPVYLGPHEGVTSTAVSPDGRWVATSGLHASGVKVWESGTGGLVKELLPGQQRCLIQFSPDGRWLAKGGVEAWLWAVGSWQPQSTIKNAWLPVFTADGSMAAVGVARHVIALVDPTTGREFARLEDPNQDLSEWYAYTPDGTRMVTSSSGENGYSIHVWDLRLIRHQLAELGLDWHLPAYPPASEGTSPSAPAPRRFDVVGVERVTDPAKWQRDEEAETLARLAANPFDVEARYLLGRRLYEQGRWEPAYRHLGFALALQPEFSPAHYFRAWAATRLGRWDEALADLNIVAEHEPTHPSVRWVRGLVYQRLQRHAEAVADFTADAARHPRDGQVLERRAASYEALGRKAEAEADREKALALSPTASLLNERAWNLVTGGQRNPEKALGLIREAMKKEPGNALYLNTLGVVQYRLGRYEEAVTTLEKSLAAGKGESDAFDLFFLAMCYHRLGESDKARDRFDRAVRWVERRQKELDPGAREELRAFRAEAEELLRSPAP